MVEDTGFMCLAIVDGLTVLNKDVKFSSFEPGCIGACFIYDSMKSAVDAHGEDAEVVMVKVPKDD